MSATYDPDRLVLESGLLSSGNSVDLENDHLGGDTTDSFDTIMQLFTTDGNQSANVLGNSPPLATESDLSHPFIDFENQFSSEAFNLQPESGASAQGCDDEGIAVGSI